MIPKENIRLYRDDSLDIVHMTPQETENVKRQLCEKFIQLGLQITDNANSTVTDFLDISYIYHL